MPRLTGCKLVLIYLFFCNDCVPQNGECLWKPSYEKPVYHAFWAIVVHACRTSKVKASVMCHAPRHVTLGSLQRCWFTLWPTDTCVHVTNALTLFICLSLIPASRFTLTCLSNCRLEFKNDQMDVHIVSHDIKFVLGKTHLWFKGWLLPSTVYIKH